MRKNTAILILLLAATVYLSSIIIGIGKAGAGNTKLIPLTNGAPIDEVEELLFAEKAESIESEPTEEPDTETQEPIVEEVSEPSENNPINTNSYVNVLPYTEEDAVMIAKTMGVECPNVGSKTEQACVAWCILNRYDAGFASTIAGVITAPKQFAYYSSTPVRQDLYELALDVLSRWADEKNGEEDVGRVLPKEYKWFGGDCCAHNYFRDQYVGGNMWDYSLPSPYDT